jgi:hypothetical protein
VIVDMNASPRRDTPYSSNVYPEKDGGVCEIESSSFSVGMSPSAEIASRSAISFSSPPSAA